MGSGNGTGTSVEVGEEAGMGVCSTVTSATGIVVAVGDGRESTVWVGGDASPQAATEAKATTKTATTRPESGLGASDSSFCCMQDFCFSSS